MATHESALREAKNCRYWAHELARGVRVAVLAASVFLLGYSTLPANAQEPELGIEPNQPESKVPNINDGQVLAHKLCVNCHFIDEATAGAAEADVPSFPSIANRPNQSIESLTNWLMAPHAPMPDPHLTRKEIRDLAGYILSLKTRQ